jgi:hypothetical protein
MATSVKGRVDVSSDFQYENTGNEQRTNQLARISYSQDFESGTGDEQANVVWTKEYNQSAAVTVDLAGSLTDIYGQTVTLTKVRCITIKNLSTTTGFTLTVGGAASNQFSSPFGSATDKVKVPPGGCLVLAAPLDGFTVTAGSGDQLKMDPGGTNQVNWMVQIVGN